MGRKRKGDPVHGWVVLDKPYEMTSTQAVGAVKRIFNAQKAGHGGTLDPLATGLLPIALGEATKTVSFVMDGQKTYRFTVRWGIETDTDDREGQIINTSEHRPAEQDVLDVLGGYTGSVLQTPPRYSAIKIAGERAYDKARDGEAFALDAREVQIDELNLVETPGPDETVLEVACGKGTYVRALARDMGRELGCFGHVSSLRRTRVGPFQDSDMISLDKLNDLRHIGAGQACLAEILCSMETALDDIPALAVSGAEAARLKNGQAIVLLGRDAPIFHGTVLVASGGHPVALAEVKQGALHPKRVFNLSGSNRTTLE